MYSIFISASIIVYIYIYTLGSSCLPACYDIILPSTYTAPISYYSYNKIYKRSVLSYSCLRIGSLIGAYYIYVYTVGSACVLCSMPIKSALAHMYCYSLRLAASAYLFQYAY